MTFAYRQAGITLVELLIALAIFSILSVASVGILRTAIVSKERATDLADQLSALEQSRAIIRSDLLQIADRPYRQNLELGLTPAVLGGVNAEAATESLADEQVLLIFVRHGWSNPGATLPRGTLQHVTYLLSGDKVVRRTRPFVDNVRETPRRDQILFGGVSDVALDFFGPRGWLADFRSVRGTPRPPAIRLSFVHPDYGLLEQLFLTGPVR